MTVRSVVIGLSLAFVVAAFGYANDWVCRLPYVASDLMPVSVYGLLLLGLIAINPLLRRLRLSQLRGPEWALITALVLTACAIPGPGLLWQFHNVLVMPHHIARVTPGWRATDDHPALLSYVPESMLTNPEPGGNVQEDDVVSGFLQGIGVGNAYPPLADIPWKAWLRPYAFYVPLILLGATATLCLILVLHVQWSRHEHLPYPMATFAGILLGDDPESPFQTLFRASPFWIGFSAAFGILLLNGCYTWWPEYLIPVPNYVNLRPLAVLVPWLRNVPGGLDTLFPRFFFAVVGLAFLVSAEVSFSVGVSMIVYSIVFGILAGIGVKVNNEYMAGGILGYQLFGAYAGAALFIAYTGRHYYAGILKAALGKKSGTENEPYVVWACRILFISTAAVIILLHTAAGLDLVVAVLLVFLFGLLFVNVTRINAETGLLFVQPTWQPIGILLALFGAHALGPGPLIVCGLLCVVFTIDPRVCLMPLAANALKLGEQQRLSLPKQSIWMAVAFLVCLVGALPITLYLQYTSGGGVLYGWANTATQMPFDLLSSELNRLAALGTLSTADAGSGKFGLARLATMSPKPVFLWSAAAGLLAVVACHAARLRWKWWPLHPVLLMVWGTLVSRWFAGSFLLGWLIKWAVVRFGNSKTYQMAQQLCIGLIAGEMVAGVFWMLIGILYFLIERTPPPLFRVHL